MVVHSDQDLVLLGSIENEQSQFGESIGTSSTGTGAYLFERVFMIKWLACHVCYLFATDHSNSPVNSIVAVQLFSLWLICRVLVER